MNHVLFAEGSQALVEGDADRGLRLLRELLERKARLPRPDQSDRIGLRQADRACHRAGALFQRARILHELENLAARGRGRECGGALFVARATRRLQPTAGKSGPERLDALVDAVRIWPTLEGAEAEYSQAFIALPTTRCGRTGCTRSPRSLGTLAGRSPAEPIALPPDSDQR